MVLKAELGEFLRTKRKALRPDDVGLPGAGRRRVPGLRRDEVARLANMSTNYYERLELATGPRPSAALLAGLARAMRLTDDERAYLYTVADQSVPVAPPDGTIDPGLRHVMEALSPSVPAFVSDDLSTILQQNALAVELMGAFAELPAPDNNLLWRYFTDLEWRERTVHPDYIDDLGHKYVARLRAGMARRNKDEASTTLVEGLHRTSAQFRAIWAEHNVNVVRTTRKIVLNRLVGELDFECEPVMSVSSGQQLVLFRPQPGTPTLERLESLSRHLVRSGSAGR
ncbi:helix-turn-helix transcriptional regulator [Actinocrispum sp. NPDC049592]|uniref:helix-turn-helix transcriptional regulator n=1 Tax=Actinocrispum sp. NPDC049592 TaxID=3154835 RepID=UPI0034207056